MSYYEEFINGWVPETLDIEGDWIVKGLIGPLPIRFFGHTKQFHQATADAFSGNNKFIGDRLRAGYYKASIGPSQLQPELEVININYDVPENPRIMRGLTDEVRFVNDHKMIGRGVYRLAGTSMKPRNIFWFTVEKPVVL